MCNQQLRQHIIRQLLKVNFLLSTAHGLYPYRYDAATRQLMPSKCLNYYCLIVNAAMLLVLAYMTTHQLYYAEVQFISGKPLNALLLGLHTILSVLTLLITFVANWLGRAAIMQLYKTLAAMPQMGATMEHLDSSALYYTIGKSVTTLLQMASNLYGKLGINPQPSSAYIIYTVLIFFVKNVHFLTANNFCFAAQQLHEQLQQLNAALQQLLLQQLRSIKTAKAAQSVVINASDATAATPFKCACLCAAQNKGAPPNCCWQYANLCGRYLLLCRLIERIGNTYQWQLLVFLLTLLIGNTMSSFYFLVYLSGKVVPTANFSLALFPQIFIINMLDLYFYMIVCERTINVTKQTNLLMRQLNVEQLQSLECEKGLEMFNILLAGKRPEFTLCGLFHWNLCSGFKLIITTYLYVIVLVHI